jgi:short-chain Z-isoprenyl diphosphate synthase
MLHEIPVPTQPTETALVPRHLGIIPDGNRRWARRRGLSTAAGFQAGAERVPQVLGWCADRGIGHITLWVMSQANLRRQAAETAAMTAYADRLVRGLAGLRRWRLRPIGRLDLLPPELLDTLAGCAGDTADVPGPIVNLAVGYSGREDIADAVRLLLRSPDAGTRPGRQIAETLTADGIARYLSTGDQPGLDLVVRTSGEMRMSDFMIWQLADSELYFSPRLWPDFAEPDLDDALAAFRTRDRRFGI